MKITTVLFDLDGTLLPMDQEVFVKAYFGFLAKKLAPYGYEPEKLIKAIWAGTGAMIKNNGECLNEKRFWDTFRGVFGAGALSDIPIFDEFYRKEFEAVKEVCGFNNKAAQVIKKVHESGRRAVLATNPIFPAVATRARIRWAGLRETDFDFYTTYENSSFCKPNPDYYREVLKRANVTPGECVMVGNDVSEDMIAKSLGMDVFLLTDCVINKNDEDISVYKHGGFDELLEFIENLK